MNQEFKDGNFIFTENDPNIFKKIIISALLEKLKTTSNKISDEDYLNYKLNAVMTENILIVNEIMKKSNYDFLKNI